jgi:hypothetical protein
VPSQHQPEPPTSLRLRRVLVPHDRNPARPSRGLRAVWVWSVLLVLVGLAVAVALQAEFPLANLTDKLGGF